MTLGAEEQRELLRIARAAIGRAIGAPSGEVADVPRSASVTAERAAGAFVSLHRRADDELRGCIGCFEGRGTLAETVARMAVEAATHDPRFPPVRVAELDSLSIEISVLSPMLDIEDPRRVEPGTHGLVVSRGGRRGVLLPQVATEYGWSREEFLDHTCLKAGLQAGDWRRPGTRLQTFTAEVFGEIVD